MNCGEFTTTISYIMLYITTSSDCNALKYKSRRGALGLSSFFSSERALQSTSLTRRVPVAHSCFTVEFHSSPPCPGADLADSATHFLMYVDLFKNSKRIVGSVGTRQQNISSRCMRFTDHSKIIGGERTIPRSSIPSTLSLSLSLTFV